MSWSWRIGRIAGIPIFVHWTFLILIGWLVIANARAGRSPAEIASEIGFVLALFGCVVLHELGHALMARRFGVTTDDITLLPIGGVARLQRIPEKPVEELLVAIAGPAVNVVIAMALYLMGARIGLNLRDEHVLLRGALWGRLLLVNVFLVAFNLIPAFPMDGGRILRALLAMKMEYGRATRVAATIGQMLAIGFGFLGLLDGNVMLFLIALFVWIGAQTEASAVTERIELRGVKVREAMLTEYESLPPGATLGRAAELLLAGSQQDFPVVENGSAVGVLTRAALIQGLARAGADSTVASHSLTSLGSVDADAPLVQALGELRETGAPCLQVIDRAVPVGLLTLENATEFLMIKSAIQQSKPQGAAQSTNVARHAIAADAGEATQGDRFI